MGGILAEKRKYIETCTNKNQEEWLGGQLVNAALIFTTAVNSVAVYSQTDYFFSSKHIWLQAVWKKPLLACTLLQCGKLDDPEVKRKKYC